MTTPILGTTPAGPLALDLERLIEGRMLIQGGSNAGKSWLVRLLLEQTFGHVQQIVLDVEDEYPSLRERFPFVLGGPGRDFPVEVRSAELLARRLLELRASAILNLFELKPAERPRFVRLFLDALMASPKAMWNDALVVVEESSMLAPQSGREAESTVSLVDLAQRGRKRGFAGVFVCQRISDLHKSVVGLCQNRLIGSTTLEADVKRAAYELGFERSDARQLIELPRGTFFAFGPALSKSVVRLEVGKVQTEHGRKRGKRAAAAPPAPEAVRQLLAQLADLPAEAAQEAKTLESQRARIRELEHHLVQARRGTGSPTPTSEQLEKAHNQGVREARKDYEAFEREKRQEIAALERRCAELEALDDQAKLQIEQSFQNGWREGWDVAVDDARRHLERVQASVTHALEQEFKPVPAVERAAPVRAATARRTAPVHPAPLRRQDPVAPPRRAREAGSSDLAGPKQRILDELAALEALGLERPPKHQVGLLCGYTNPRSGGFSEPLAELRTAGLVEYGGDGTLYLTDIGRSAAAPSDRPSTSEELQQGILAKLEGAEARVLAGLIEAHPDALDRDKYGRSLGYSNPRSGGFSEPLGRLKKLGLVTYPQRGQVRAADVLFLER